MFLIKQKEEKEKHMHFQKSKKYTARKTGRKAKLSFVSSFQTPLIQVCNPNLSL
jgi:hypothetical protein